MFETSKKEKTPKLVYVVAAIGFACSMFALLYSHWSTIVSFLK